MSSCPSTGDRDYPNHLKRDQISCISLRTADPSSSHGLLEPWEAIELI